MTSQAFENRQQCQLSSSPGPILESFETITIQSLFELVDWIDLNVQWWEEYPVSVHQKVVDDFALQGTNSSRSGRSFV